MYPSHAFSSGPADPGRFLQDKVAAASPAELIGMCFDAAVGNLKLAQTFFRANEYASAIPHIDKAQQFVLELRVSLNPAGGDLAVSLESLYHWVFLQLLRATNEHDEDALDECEWILSELQGAWRVSCLGQQP